MGPGRRAKKTNRQIAFDCLISVLIALGVISLLLNPLIRLIPITLLLILGITFEILGFLSLSMGNSKIGFILILIGTEILGAILVWIDLFNI